MANLMQSAHGFNGFAPITAAAPAVLNIWSQHAAETWHVGTKFIARHCLNIIVFISVLYLSCIQHSKTTYLANGAGHFFHSFHKFHSIQFISFILSFISFIHSIPLHFISFHCIAFHSTSFRFISLHCIPLHFIPFHFVSLNAINFIHFFHPFHPFSSLDFIWSIYSLVNCVSDPFTTSVAHHFEWISCSVLYMFSFRGLHLRVY